jgi:hypothetical protein
LQLFLTPLKTTHANILSAKEVDAIFSNVQLILQVNKEILSNLLQDFQAAGTIELMHVGQLFLRMVESPQTANSFAKADFLKIYSIYSSNHNTSIQMYDKQKKENKEFAAFLQVFEH